MAFRLLRAAIRELKSDRPLPVDLYIALTAEGIDADALEQRYRG